MNINTISSLVMPTVILSIVIMAMMRGIRVYDTFISGAKKGLKASISIAAPLVGLLSATAMLRASGAMDLICFGLSGLARRVGFPAEVLPLAVMRPVSGSASLAVLRDILKNYGADSFQGRVAGVISGSTETTFYAMAVYFGSANIKNTRYTAKSAIIADMTSFITAAVVVSHFFGS